MGGNPEVGNYELVRHRDCLSYFFHLFGAGKGQGGGVIKSFRHVLVNNIYPSHFAGWQVGQVGQTINENYFIANSAALKT